MSFDWYKLSQQNEQNPDIQKFQSIIRSGNLTNSLERVPLTYRRNLLQMFQNLSFKVKQQTQTFNVTKESLSHKKSAISDKIQLSQSNLEQSKHELDRMKATIIEKKKMVKKLKDKIETLKKQNNKGEKYFCPLCQREDFSSRNAFSFHMFSEHQTYKAQHTQSLPNDSAHNDLKEFIMTLKYKQMEMMKMILGQKKMMQTQDLQRMYQKQVNMYTMKNASQPQYLNSRSGNNNHYDQYQNNGEQFQGQQLKGDSQFLFFQKSAQYKDSVKKQQQEYSIRKAYQNQRKTNSHGGHPYYDIFSNMQQNRSQILEQGQLKDSHKRIHKQGSSINQGGILERFSLRTQQQLMQVTRNHPKGVQPLRMNSNNQQNFQYQNYNPSTSITDRLKNHPNSSQQYLYGQSGQSVHSTSFYRESQSKNQQQQQQQQNLNNSSSFNNSMRKPIKGISNESSYIFNSGPLIDDKKGGDSDYQDYFGSSSHHNSNKKHNQRRYQHSESRTNNKYQNDDHMVEDQEIRINHGSLSFVSRSSQQQISQLISPAKEQISRRLQKSSQIVDLSEDSFSRRDFELSKDEDDTINLSDLKLSKLEKRKKQQKSKINMYSQEKIERKSPNRNNSQGQHQDQERSYKNFSKHNKTPNNFILISEQKQLNIPRENQQKIVMLTQFQRKIQPLKPGSFNFIKQQAYRRQQDSNNQPTHLQQFYKKYVPQPQMYRGARHEDQQQQQQNQNIDKPMSPQQYFKQQFQQKSHSSKQTIIQQYKAQNNEERMYQPKIDLSEFQNKHIPAHHHVRVEPIREDLSKYEKPMIGGYSSNGQHSSSVSGESQRTGSYSMENKKSRSSSRKKFQRHKDLEDSSNGILGQFIRPHITEESYQAKKQQFMQHSEVSSGPSKDNNALDEFIK